MTTPTTRANKFTSGLHGCDATARVYHSQQAYKRRHEFQANTNWANERVGVSLVQQPEASW